MIVQLLAGMFIGSVVVCIVGGLLLKAAKNKSEATRREREEIMRSLGGLWVQIDSLISAHRGSKSASKPFKDSFRSKIDEINRLFKPNMHKFDVYYVKYTENLIAHYTNAVLKGGSPVDVIAAASADVELETNYSVVEQVVAASPVIAAPPAAPATVEAAPTLKHAAIAEVAVPPASQVQPNVVVEKPGKVPEDASEGVAIVDFEKSAVPAAPDTDLFEITSVSGEMPATASVDDKADSLPIITASESKPDSDEPFDFEAVKAPDQEFTMEVAMDKAPETVAFSRKAPPPVEEDMTAFEETMAISAPEVKSKKTPPAHSGSDEDFSMETLIDVDISTISPYLKKEGAPKVVLPAKTEEQLFEVTSGKKPPQAEAANLEVVIASNASHTGAVDKKAPTPQVEKEDAFEAIFDQAPAASKTGPVAPQGHSSGVTQADLDRFDKDEESITGDDVANKIAALEFSGDSFPQKAPAGKVAEVKKDNPPVVKQPPVLKPAAIPPEKKIPAAGIAAATGLKPKSHDDTITGDDVADKIDAFFGLFDEK